MNQVKEYPLPENNGNRIVGYDIARGIAIFLMLLINFKGALSLPESHPEGIFYIIDFLNRRAAVVLVMVSGIGLTLFTKNPLTMGYANPRPGSRRILLDRSVFLFVSGYAFTLIWAGDILHFYAVFILIGVFLAARSNKSQIIAAIVFWLGSFIQFFEIYDYMQDDQYYSYGITHLNNLLFTGYYPVFPWAAFFIAGMFLGRLDLQDKCLRRKILAIGLFLLIASELISRFFDGFSEQIRPASSIHFDTNLVLVLGWIMEIDLTVPTPFSVISGIGTGILVVIAGISLSVLQRIKLIRSIIIGGRNTLTLYIGHIIFLILICLVFNISNTQGVLFTVLSAILVFFAYIKAMSLWLKKYDKGPFETVMRQFSLQRLFLKKYYKVMRNNGY